MFTSDYDEHARTGKVMCWPFAVVSCPSSMPQPHPRAVAITFDGTSYAVYEHTWNIMDDSRMHLQPQLVVTNVTKAPRAQLGVIDFLRIDREGQALTVVPVYQFHPPQEAAICQWRDDIEIFPLRLNVRGGMIITEWNETSFYFLRWGDPLG